MEYIMVSFPVKICVLVVSFCLLNISVTSLQVNSNFSSLKNKQRSRLKPVGSLPSELIKTRCSLRFISSIILRYQCVSSDITSRYWIFRFHHSLKFRPLDFVSERTLKLCLELNPEKAVYSIRNYSEEQAQEYDLFLGFATVFILLFSISLFSLCRTELFSFYLWGIHAIKI